MGGIEVGLIHRRILPHPDQREAAEGKPAGFIGFEPTLRQIPAAGRRADLRQTDRLGQHQGALTLNGEVSRRADPDLMTSPLGRLHQGNAGVLGGTQPRDRIDHEQLRGQTASERAQAQAPSRASS